MNNKPGQPQQSHRPPTVNPFAKSPVEMGGAHSSQSQKASTFGEHLDGALNFIADSLFGSTGASGSSQDKSNPSDNTGGSNNLFADALKKEQGKNSELQTQLDKQKHLAKHKEMQMTEVFDLEKKRSEQMIKQIKEELNMLVKEIGKMSGNVDQSIHTAVFQGSGEAGKYYENFFAQLRNFLVLLTKRVKEGNTWLQTFHSKKGKSLYERNSAKYGSQYQFGQEGQGLTRSSG